MEWKSARQRTEELRDRASRVAMTRIVLDTDILVAAAYARRSASRQVLEACLRREVHAAVSTALLREYTHILSRAVRGRDFGDLFQRFLEQAEMVELVEIRRIVPDDPGDDKVVATALAAGADAIVTNDRHLLQLDPYGKLRIVRPAEFVRRGLRNWST
jgi:putative PIN family toxin of toxin-antitoxin system